MIHTSRIACSHYSQMCSLLGLYCFHWTWGYGGSGCRSYLGFCHVLRGLLVLLYLPGVLYAGGIFLCRSPTSCLKILSFTQYTQYVSLGKCTTIVSNRFTRLSFNIVMCSNSCLPSALRPTDVNYYVVCLAYVVRQLSLIKSFFQRW